MAIAGGREPVMAIFGEGGEFAKCSFCGKSQKLVKKLIAGPGVHICNECLDRCNDIVEQEPADSSDVRFGEPGGWPSCLHAAQQGNEDAWGQVFRLQNPAVLRYLAHYQRVDAMAQEVWLRAKQGLGGLVGDEDEEAFEAWLFSIARQVLAYDLP